MWAPITSSERRRRILSTWWAWAAAELGTAGEERTQQDSSVRSVRQRGSETKIIKLSVGDVCPRGHHAAIEFSSGKTLITAVTTGDQLTLRHWEWECCREYLRSCCVNKTASKAQQVNYNLYILRVQLCDNFSSFVSKFYQLHHWQSVRVRPSPSSNL